MFCISRYKDTLKDLKQTRKLLQETERKREELETANYAHKQKLQSVEMGYEDQVNQMREKVTELTNKLAASDRRLKRFNRRSSGKKNNIILVNKNDGISIRNDW